MTAQVAVSNATFHFDKLYSYSVPAHLEDAVHVGSMVLVPFGRGSGRARMGVVLAVLQQAPGPGLKALYDAAPETARLSPELLRLVHYLKERTFCTYYDAVRAVIPYGAQYKAVQESGVPRLQKQLVRHTENVYARGEPAQKYTPKQQQAWDALGAGPMSQSELAALGLTRAVLDNLVQKGTLLCTLQDKSIPLYTGAIPTGPVTLSPAQQRAFDELDALRTSGVAQTALLHGVTSSGKTLVFLKLLEQTLAAGRTALVLVPEISLTPQMIYRLKGAFGERVAVQHSALNHTERLLQWQQIQSGEADIVVGTRSAVFAPLEHIGLIIIDEEQEHTYHSENAPRYAAHDIAHLRASQNDALLLLASATPSVETYWAAQQGRIHLVELPERYNKQPLPAVELVDMRSELAAGNTGALSAQLKAEITRNLAAQKQTILLLNRRGYKTVGMCTKCAEAIKCDACSVPMVYHKAEDKLLCHYCGKSISPVPQTCPVCGERIKYTGFGTQRVEEELAQEFPTARVLRMDLDTTARKNAHETMLRDFAAGTYDIMLGTQMVAKGLDFERVTLVGVLGIDQLLFAQGYKAFENVFSLVTQVVGRGGRADTPGRALIQTVDPDHPVLNLAAKQDYASFYQQEIAFRKLNLYPPFCTLCMAGFTGEDEGETLQAATAFARLVQAQTQQANANGARVPLRILGPAPMNVSMVNHRFRYKLTLKCRSDAAFRAMLGEALTQYNAAGLVPKAAVYVDFHSDADS